MIMQKLFLTPREREIFLMLTCKENTEEISKRLGISEKTVRNHISNVIQKLGVKGRNEAMKELIKIGELSQKQIKK